MGFLVVLLILALILIASGFFAWRWLKTERAAHSRDQARLRIIEGQLAALRAVLRIQVAEHALRRAMAMQSYDLFENRTDHEEYHS